MKRFEGKMRHVSRETGLLGALFHPVPFFNPTAPESTNISFGPREETISDDQLPNQKRRRTSNQNLYERENKMNLANVKKCTIDMNEKKTENLKLPKLHSGRCQSVPDENRDFRDDVFAKKKKVKNLRY